MKSTRQLIFLLIAVLGFVLPLQAQDDMMTGESHVFEIAVRGIADAEEFARQLPLLEGMLQGAEGYLGSREYTAFFTLVPELEEGTTLVVSITEWTSVDAYESGMSLLENTDILAYFESLVTVQNLLVTPFEYGDSVTLEDFPDAGEVLELAIRDLSTYEDPVDFIRALQGFTSSLIDQPGALREYSWVSVDGQFFVGMTRYESMAAFGTISESGELLALPHVQYAFMNYPPMLNTYGMLAE